MSVEKLTVQQLQSLLFLYNHAESGMPSNRTNARQLNGLKQKGLARWVQVDRHGSMRYKITESGVRLVKSALDTWNRQA